MFKLLEKFLTNHRKMLFWLFGILALYLLVFHNLTRFPAPWFDEGSHLHVPKTLVQYGVYADISSEGFRYYGPTIGVGPTVMLPIAAMFKLIGIGLLQARFVMAIYLIAAVYVFYRLVEHLSGEQLAWIALALVLSSRAVLLLNYGRQLLGEVPGLFYLLLGLYLWFSGWDKNDWKRLALVGLIFGLAMVTKYQYLLFLAPTLIISWVLDIFYYKSSSNRNFLIPGIIAAGSFGFWQLISLQYLGPSTAMENLALLRASAEGAAFNFDLGQATANLGNLTARSVYLGALIPSLAYGLFISIPRTSDGQRWSILLLLVGLNLVWYVLVSIGWIRYVFLGFALASIFVARFFSDLTDGFKFDWSDGIFPSLFKLRNAKLYAITLWLLAIILTPMTKTVLEIVQPEPAYARQMADYLDGNVSSNAVIETWDPEMGFLTDHSYHYPPNALLAVAVDQVYYGGDPVQDRYDFVRTEHPEYLLVGEFSKWTQIYPLDDLMDDYELVQSFGEYDLYQRID
jgi:hypothetical protein